MVSFFSLCDNCVFLSQGLYDQALEDCEKALHLNEGNYKALYRKAKSLKEMGRHAEAYETVAKCSLAVPQVGCNVSVEMYLPRCAGTSFSFSFQKTGQKKKLSKLKYHPGHSPYLSIVCALKKLDYKGLHQI